MIFKAGRWYQKIRAQVNLDKKDPENDDGEIRFSIWALTDDCVIGFVSKIVIDLSPHNWNTRNLSDPFVLIQ